MRDDLSLQQIDGQDWGEPEAAATPMIRRCLEARRKPLRELTPGDYRLLLGQQANIEVLVSCALALVDGDPLLEADYYPGDLLAAILHVPASYWRENVHQRDMVARIVESIDQSKKDRQRYEELLQADLINPLHSRIKWFWESSF